MAQSAKERERERRARARLRVLHHWEHVTRNISQTCRFFGISRTIFYLWRCRYRQGGLPALRDGYRGAPNHPTRPRPTWLPSSCRCAVTGSTDRYYKDQLLPPALPPGVRVGPHYPSDSQTPSSASGLAEALPPRPPAPSGLPRRGPVGPGRCQASAPGVRAGSTSSRPSTKRLGIGSCRSTRTTRSAPRPPLSRRFVAGCPSRSSAFRPTMDPSSAPISPGICETSGSPTDTSPQGAPRRTARSNGVIGRTRTSSTAA